MSKKSFTVTTVGDAPTVDRANRMRTYTITMSIRMACVIAIAFVDGWWILVCAIGAVFLPYIAVVVANVRSIPDREPDLENVQLQLGGDHKLEEPEQANSSIIIPADETAVRVKSVEKYE